MWQTRLRSDAGFTLIEAMVTLCIMGIVGGMATASMVNARKSFQGDAAMRMVMSEINTAREMAITQRHNMELQFIGGNWVRVRRHEVPATTPPTTTILRNVALESYATVS